MTVDLISPRPDVVFLRRRLKVGETLPTKAAPASSAPSTGLRLSGPEEPVVTLSGPPLVRGRVVLDEDNPVVRLDSRQSAIGSLIGENVTVFGWETTDRLSGIEFSPAEDLNPEDITHMRQLFDEWTQFDKEKRGINPATAIKHDIPQFSNRKLVDFYKGEFVLGLRNFRKLRRAAVGAYNGVITLKLLDGNSVVIDTDNGRNVIYISPIGNQLELRWERLTGTIGSTFSIPSLAS